MSDMWSYQGEAWSEGDNVVGYEVEATDGSIGKVDAATSEAGAAYLVVDTGPWILNKLRVIPAGHVTRVDHDAETVTVTLSKDQVRAAPDYDESTWDEDAKAAHANHYGRSA
jgi:hypothetical protein